MMFYWETQRSSSYNSFSQTSFPERSPLSSCTQEQIWHLTSWRRRQKGSQISLYKVPLRTQCLLFNMVPNLSSTVPSATGPWPSMVLFLQRPLLIHMAEDNGKGIWGSSTLPMPLRKGSWNPALQVSETYVFLNQLNMEAASTALQVPEGCLHCQGCFLSSSIWSILESISKELLRFVSCLTRYLGGNV